MSEVLGLGGFSLLVVPKYFIADLDCTKSEIWNAWSLSNNILRNSETNLILTDNKISEILDLTIPLRFRHIATLGWKQLTDFHPDLCASWYITAQL